MSFFGGKRDTVTASAISDAVSEPAISKMRGQARVRWSGLTRIGIILRQPAVPIGVRNLSCMLRTVERAECRADRTVEEIIGPHLQAFFAEHQPQARQSADHRLLP
jgi:hypothetical protein